MSRLLRPAPLFPVLFVRRSLIQVQVGEPGNAGATFRGGPSHFGALLPAVLLRHALGAAVTPTERQAEART